MGCIGNGGDPLYVGPFTVEQPSGSAGNEVAGK